MTLDTHIKNWKAEEVRQELRREAVNLFVDDLKYYICTLNTCPKELQYKIYDWYVNYPQSYLRRG